VEASVATAGPVVVFALALGAGVVGLVVAHHLRLPAIVPLLGLGAALGPDGLGWIEPRALGGGLYALMELGVAVILFEGGLGLEWRRLRRESRAIQRLVTLGAAVTTLGGALAARVLLGWSWPLAFLFGTLVIVTGPTVIGPLLRRVRVRPRLATVLEGEGVLIDPIGVIVAVVALQVVLGGDEPLHPELGRLAIRLGFGAAAGLLGGLALALTLRAGRLVPEGLENLVALGGVLVLAALCDRVLSQTGILAVTVAGVVVGNSGVRVDRELREFQGLLTHALIGILFVLLVADVRLADATGLGLPGLAVVAVLVLLVRPANVALCTIGSELAVNERAFLAWIAPRGIVAAGIASLFGEALEAAGIPGAREVRALVFLTIAATVLLQGGSAAFVARLLGVRVPGRDAVAVLGADDLAIVFADVLRRGGRRVLLLDANPDHCRAAEEHGFPVVFGNALEPRTLARARLEQAAVAVGLTPNDEVNSIFAREARDAFRVPRTYVAVSRIGTAVTPAVLERQSSRSLFDRPKDVERWSVRLRHDAARLERYRHRGEGADSAPAAAPGGASDPWLVLAVERSGTVEPMYDGFVPRAGDVGFVLVHVPEATAAAEALHRLGWDRVGDSWNGAADGPRPGAHAGLTLRAPG
jgi:NhaP-type Na+/H+ or K+/H+ antiporter